MKRRSVGSFIATIVCTLAFSTASALAGPQKQMVKVGKKGDVTLSQEVMFGEAMLKPGRYIFQHRLVGKDHFVWFTHLSDKNPYFPTASAPAGHPGEVKCELEPLNHKAERTAIFLQAEGGMQRITRIEVAGENVAHVF